MTPQFLSDTPVSEIDAILKLQPVIVPEASNLVHVAQRLIQTPSVHVICVVNDTQQLVGLLPLQTLADDLFMAVVPEEFIREAHDLDEALHFANMSHTQTAGDAMLPPVWIKSDSTLRQAFKLMHQNKLPGIPIVTDQMDVTGYINLLELLAVYAQSQQQSEN